MNKNKTWTDDLYLSKTEKDLWKKFCFFNGGIILVLSFSLAIVSYYYFNNVKNQKLLLVAPTLGVGPIEVESGSKMTNHIMEMVSQKIVNLNESWTYESLGSNLDELFTYYYNKELSEHTKANILSQDRINYVKQNRMVSIFKLDKNKSRSTWCSELNRMCSMIVGERTVFINNNEIFSEKEIAYLIFAQAVFPTNENRHAVRVTRLKLDDYSDSPYNNISKQYEAAVRGVLPNE